MEEERLQIDITVIVRVWHAEPGVVQWVFFIVYGIHSFFFFFFDTNRKHSLNKQVKQSHSITPSWDLIYTSEQGNK